jgi:Holliday junction resolvase RusA-like endonuclease
MVLPQCGAHVIFHLPMPSSWSRKKRDELRGQAHQQNPDADNLFKALGDALYADDSGIWDVRITKRWADVGAIEIT